MTDTPPNGRGLHQTLKTHCPRGHEYSKENTYRWRGRRFCRECSRINQRNQWANRKHGEEE